MFLIISPRKTFLSKVQILPFVKSRKLKKCKRIFTLKFNKFDITVETVVVRSILVKNVTFCENT